MMRLLLVDLHVGVTADVLDPHAEFVFLQKPQPLQLGRDVLAGMNQAAQALHFFHLSPNFFHLSPILCASVVFRPPTVGERSPRSVGHGRYHDLESVEGVVGAPPAADRLDALLAVVFDRNGDVPPEACGALAPVARMAERVACSYFGAGLVPTIG
jgi:hypothetical protein